MHFRQIAPPPALRDYVRYFWALESTATADGPQSFRTIADGSPGVIFQQTEKGVMHQAGKALPGLILYGQYSSHAELTLSGHIASIGVYFYPHALRTIFGLPPADLTDTCMDLGQHAQGLGFPILEELQETLTAEQRVARISAFLLDLLRRNEREHNPVMKHALQRILSSGGAISLKALREELQCTERTFERHFKSYVGISPKLFVRIARVQASLQQLRQGAGGKLSDLAYGHDFADQSHFIRSFREFTGYSPLQFRKQSPEILDNFALIAP
ncbi:DUF6597 domain-containing transcriptional factor [Chitinophaga lutea]